MPRIKSRAWCLLAFILLLCIVTLIGKPTLNKGNNNNNNNNNAR